MANFLFQILGLVFCYHQIGILGNLPFAFIARNYLDPFLLMPLMLWLILFERSVMYNKQEKLTTNDILKLTISTAFVCEVLFPHFSDKFTRDFYDVIAYFLGSLFYIAFMNRHEDFTPDHN